MAIDTRVVELGSDAAAAATHLALQNLMSENVMHCWSAALSLAPAMQSLKLDGVALLAASIRFRYEWNSGRPRAVN